jgi:alpha-beta hydrolase superfamily lysophospholipase
MDMAQGIEDAFKINDYNNINKNIPVLIISGSEDPVGEFKRGVISLYNFLRNFFTNMDIKIFEDERHEVFSGNKKREVYKSFKSFIEKA